MTPHLGSAGQLTGDLKEYWPVHIGEAVYWPGDMVPLEGPWAGNESAGGPSTTELVRGAEERVRSLEHSLGYGPTRSVLDV